MSEKKKNRTRDKQIILRVTEQEYDMLMSKMERSKFKNRTDFFMECMSNKPITIIENLREILVELKRQGNNLNQIARCLNEGSAEHGEVINTLHNCNMAYKSLIDFHNGKKVNQEHQVSIDTEVITKEIDIPSEDKNIVLCPICSKEMIKRKSYKGEFWGCSCYPNCKGTRDI